MSETKTLLSLVQAFFQDYLAGQRGLSPNTILAYRDTLKLFLAFLAGRSGKPAAKLRLEDLKAEQVLAFLEDVEQKRNNCTATRNLRLAALRTFFQYMMSRAEEKGPVLSLYRMLLALRRPLGRRGSRLQSPSSS